MKRKLYQAYDKLERQREKILQKTEGLNGDQLSRNPAEGKWSILQILAHLVKAESLSLTFIERSYSRYSELPDAGISSAIRFQLLKWGLKLPISYKAPAMADTTGYNPDFDELINDWEKVRDRLKLFIEECDDASLGKSVYKHPRAGDLNVLQATKFMQFHVAHHEKQLENLITAVKS
ncbi:MAG: DinB family protein [Balneolaceae bacterium]|nr:MAG: DinB family protein [Balneolaceae bacterium]